MSGLILAVFKPAYPPTVPTPEAVWDGFLATDIDYSFTVPSFIEVSGSNWVTIFVLMHLQLAMVARSGESGKDAAYEGTRGF